MVSYLQYLPFATILEKEVEIALSPNWSPFSLLKKQKQNPEVIVTNNNRTINHIKRTLKFLYLLIVINLIK